MRIFINMVCILIAVFIITSSAQSQIIRTTVSVDGMSCPFCSYGVEKKLKKVDGVESVTINMKEGTATLEAKEGESIQVGQVPQAVKDAGFTPGEIKITATGYIQMDEQQRLSLQIGKPARALFIEDIKDPVKEQLLASAKSEVMVKIVGVIQEKSDGVLTLSPQTVTLHD